MTCMKIYSFLILMGKKMIINLLPNDRIPKPKKGQYATAAAVKTLPPTINVECEVSSSISQ